MAELTNLESKLGEVLGQEEHLGIALKSALDLAGREDPHEVAE